MITTSRSGKPHHASGVQAGGAPRVGLYARVSTDEQRERQTIDAQVHALRQHAAQRGWDVAKEYLDDGVSGTSWLNERPAGARLLADAAAGEFDRVLLVRGDRLARDTEVALNAYKALSRVSEVQFVEGTFDDSPAGEFTMTILFAAAKLEHRSIVARTMAGKERAAREGRYVVTGTVPFGFQRGAEHGTIEPDPTTAPIVRRIYELAADGDGVQAIASTLTDEAVPPPLANDPKRRGKHMGQGSVPAWSPGTISKLIRHPRYRGENTFKGEAMHCPSLVSDELWNRANRAMSRRANRPRPKSAHPAMLRGLVKCRRCGSGYAFETNTRKNTRTGEPISGVWQHYQCHQRRRYGPSAGHDDIKWRWAADDLEARVKQGVMALLDDPERVQRDLRVWADEWREHAAQVPGRLAALDATIVDAEAQRERLTDLLVRGVIDEAEYGHAAAAPRRRAPSRDCRARGRCRRCRRSRQERVGCGGRRSDDPRMGRVRR
ncbi:MAG: recombinase family protein [Chloroflexi bacterium]|nr:recombinase family protein [Chloroflexota bacterium]